MIIERVLMGPGPSNIYPGVRAALARPLLGHLDPEFLALLDATCDYLRQVLVTSNPLTFPVSGTGSAGMEAALVNLVQSGDPVVVGVNGVFGMRLCEVARRCGAQVLEVEASWGQPLDPQRLLEAHPSPKVIAVVHAETSTGVRNDIESLGRNKGDALLLVDCVTSLGGIPLYLDEWKVDVAYSATQKCLGVPPGLSPLSLSARAREQLVSSCRSWYLDLSMIAEYLEPSTRTYHHTAPVSMIFALHAGLGVLLEEGLEAAWRRHRECGLQLQNGLQKLGFNLLVEEGNRLPQLTTALIPDGLLPRGLTEADVRRLLLEHYGIEIGAGLGPLAGRMWRIGCMGHTARLGNVTLLLGALGETLAR